MFLFHLANNKTYLSHFEHALGILIKTLTYLLTFWINFSGWFPSLCLCSSYCSQSWQPMSIPTDCTNCSVRSRHNALHYTALHCTALHFTALHGNTSTAALGRALTGVITSCCPNLLAPRCTAVQCMYLAQCVIYWHLSSSVFAVDNLTKWKFILEAI